MNNFDYIFKYNTSNNSKKLRFLNKKIICQIDNKTFGADVIIKIIGFVKNLSNILKGFPIVFKFTQFIKINDKLSYIIFECICYYLIEKGYKVYVSINYDYDIRTCGIKFSPLNLLENGNCIKYIDKFRFELYGNHFCKLITDRNYKNPEYLSLLYGDIDCFLRNVGINDERRDEMSQTISELIGNVCEHTSSDCFIDIDIADNYYKVDDNDSINTSIKYYGVNIVILNFSENLLNHDIKIKTMGNTIEIDRYKKLVNAYNYHKQYFNKDYTEDDFFNIAVFQNRISGSSKKNEVGGTGLTCLIKSLQEKSDSDDCYVLSGNNIVYFLKEYLSYKDGWIGFNKNNDFFTDIPDKYVLNRSKMFFSGTAYNLNFVMKSEDKNE